MKRDVIKRHCPVLTGLGKIAVRRVIQEPKLDEVSPIDNNVVPSFVAQQSLGLPKSYQLERRGKCSNHNYC